VGHALPDLALQSHWKILFYVIFDLEELTLVVRRQVLLVVEGGFQSKQVLFMLDLFNLFALQTLYGLLAAQDVRRVHVFHDVFNVPESGLVDVDHGLHLRR
jgi:hypothetical protein